ncbi:sigma 54-interacting transcriptional regulator [Youngiibacter fragilis]|uniref:Fis family transcriptional regulator n=1 Tax=Youngiibacter fragilis 232.1 TaxID=994573 RepID=V7I5V7_9CLOT|nr:sigma 54-interacting transcriptional regulator [Youngiibacter fragilis]ETA81268.1 Fis family transcriptional regulator [Youngiibacter fragilis 232.1]
MIKLEYITPYPDLIKDVERIIIENSYGKKFDSISIHEFSEPDKITIASDCSIIVARGYASEVIRKKYPGIPVVEISLTGYDIINAIAECRERFKPEKIGLIGNYHNIRDMKSLYNLLGSGIRIYSGQGHSTIEDSVSKAVSDGCDVIIGGNYICQCAKQKKIQHLLIRTGPDAIERSLSDAWHLVCAVQKEREQSEIFRTITQSSSEGILYISTNGIINIANKTALNLVRRDIGSIVGSRFEESFSFISDDIRKSLETGNKILNELYNLNDRMLSVDCIPITPSDELSGVVVNFRDITRIQQMEAQIRKKLSAMGLNAKYTFSDVRYRSSSMGKTVRMAEMYAEVSSNIILVGETGTGKELLAQSIHNASPRRSNSFVAVNCAALSENLLESELFGYEEGSFTGAAKGGKVGLFEIAHNGTLFLDEISEIPITFQSKLLRVLQEREVRRVGASKVVSVDVRVITATNRDLKEMIAEGTFRQDLYYRLNTLELHIPPLRKRPEDIEVLLEHYMQKYAAKFGIQTKSIDSDAMELLKKHTFDGNIRELRNLAERLNVTVSGTRVTYGSVYSALYPGEAGYASKTTHSLKNMGGLTDREDILKMLEACSNNRSEAARRLGIDRTTLWRKLKRDGAL